MYPLHTLLVNEIYGPVKQGEGRSAGLDVVFLRLSGCNLACIWCDTPFTWNWRGTKFSHPDKFDPKDEAHKVVVSRVYELIEERSSTVRNLVISGGEPLLQQEKLLPLLKLLKSNHWWVEVETNGTIIPRNDFSGLVDQFNCSPKLSNSGPDNPIRERIKIAALSRIALFGGKSVFKFVIQSEPNLLEIQELIDLAEIKPSQVWLMPEGRTRKEQLERQELVKDIAKLKGYNFSPRLHILEFGNKRGV